MPSRYKAMQKVTVSLKIILADQQVIFRAGVARVLRLESEFELVDQCSDEPALLAALHAASGAVAIFPAKLSNDLDALLDCVEATGNRTVLVLENDAPLDADLRERVDGLIHRSVSAIELVKCVRTVAGGRRYVFEVAAKAPAVVDLAVEEVLRRLTPKELKIIALVGEGCKNKEIALQLGTKEQGIKNYLRSIYDKTGVSDRLELALYTVHHQALANVVDQVRATLDRRTHTG